jgi:hypothetical protein
MKMFRASTKSTRRQLAPSPSTTRARVGCSRTARLRRTASGWFTPILLPCTAHRDWQPPPFGATPGETRTQAAWVLSFSCEGTIWEKNIARSRSQDFSWVGCTCAGWADYGIKLYRQSKQNFFWLINQSNQLRDNLRFAWLCWTIKPIDPWFHPARPMQVIATDLGDWWALINSFSIFFANLFFHFLFRP